MSYLFTKYELASNEVEKITRKTVQEPKVNKKQIDVTDFFKKLLLVVGYEPHCPDKHWGISN